VPQYYEILVTPLYEFTAGLQLLCCRNLAYERVVVVGGKMDDKCTLKEYVTTYFGNKKKD
jgi:hypothetical protein